MRQTRTQGEARSRVIYIIYISIELVEPRAKWFVENELDEGSIEWRRAEQPHGILRHRRLAPSESGSDSGSRELDGCCINPPGS
jgi:hypothetical protein